MTMPAEQNNQDDLNEAFQRFGKRLKGKVDSNDPTKDPDLRNRLEEIDNQVPSKSQLFSEGESQLKQLKEEFHIEIQLPQNLEETIVHLLATDSSEKRKAPLTAADLYTEIHGFDQYSKLSSREFRKVLKRLEKEEVLHLSEVQETIIVQLHNKFLSEDEAAILDVAARKSGKVSLEQIMLSTQWPQVRVQMALDALIAKKMVVKKKGFVSGTRYQVPEEL
jgi:hypothetical protein